MLEPIYLVPLFLVLILALYFKWRYKTGRGKRLAEFAKSHGYEILNIEDIEIDPNQSVTDVQRHRQTSLCAFAGPNFELSCLTDSGYFSELFLESVLVKSTCESKIILFEVHAIIDHGNENPDLRQQYRHQEWEGNIAVFIWPKKAVNTEAKILGSWRLVYHKNAVIVFKYDKLNLAALWPINDLETIIKDAELLVKNN